MWATQLLPPSSRREGERGGVGVNSSYRERRAGLTQQLPGEGERGPGVNSFLLAAARGGVIYTLSDRLSWRAILQERSLVIRGSVIS